MNKIPTVFVRNPDDRRYVTDQVTPGCEWVFAREAVATRKYDGTCVMLDEDAEWWARREVKDGKNAPAGFVGVEYDRITGKRVGWEPIDQSPFAKYHAEALGNPYERRHVGTYELIGPKINGNPDKADGHKLIPHADAETVEDLYDASVGSFTPPESLVRFVGRKYGWEGVVWHHPDGHMAKLKARDYETPHD